jgi:hypothetical protein
MPLLMGVISAYALSAAFIVWNRLLTGFSRKHNIAVETSQVISKASKISIILAVVGTVLLVVQIVLFLMFLSI